MTNPIIWEFVAGVFIGILYQSKLVLKSSFWFYSLMLAAVSFGVWWIFSGASNFHGINNWGLIWLAPVCLLALGGKYFDFKVPRVLVWLGDISFSLYLFHMPVQYLISGNFIRAGYWDYTKTWAYVLAITAISIFFAGIIHRYVEVVISRYARRTMLG